MSSHKKNFINKILSRKNLPKDENENENKKKDDEIVIINTSNHDNEILHLGKNTVTINYNSRYFYTNYVVCNKSSYVLNYNLSDNEKSWINFNNIVVLPWSYLDESNDKKLFEFISFLKFDGLHYTYIDEKIKDKYIKLIHNINLKIIDK